MKRFYLLGLVVGGAVVVSCSPVTVSKCVKDYTYDGDKIQSEYRECITQTPEKMPPIHLKHQELYE